MRMFLKLDLKLFPYKIQMVQALLLQDHQSRLQYAIHFQLLARENNFLKNLLTSDGAHLHLKGHVNKQNCRYWANEYPIECISIICIPLGELYGMVYGR